jgi:hypothetical protein
MCLGLYTTVLRGRIITGTLAGIGVISGDMARSEHIKKGFQKGWAHRRRTLLSASSIFGAALLVLTTVACKEAVPSRTARTSIAACSPASLAGSARLQGETGYRIGLLTVENTGRTPCLLPTRPSVTLKRNGTVLAVREIPMLDGQSRSFGRAFRSTLRAGETATAALAWHNWCRRSPRASRSLLGYLLLSLPRYLAPLRIRMTAFMVPRCAYPKKQSTLAVGRFRAPRST